MSDKPKKSRVIVWRITQDCDMKCRFCSYSTEVNRQRDNADRALIMSFADTLKDYINATENDVLVSWIGGEPFLRRDIMKISEYMNERGVKISATTNGMHLKDETLRGINDYFSEIVFSIDSFEECDDDVRGVKGHFRTVTEKITALDKLRREKGSNLKVKVNTILMRRNISNFEAFCEYLASLGVDEVTFNRLGGYDRPDFFDGNRLLSEQSKEFAEKLPIMKKRFAEKGLMIHGGKKYMERFMSAALDKPCPVEECDPASWFWFINENGFISPCSYTSYEYKYPLCDIKTPDDFDKVEAFFREQRKNNRSKWCDNCFCTQVYEKFE